MTIYHLHVLPQLYNNPASDCIINDGSLITTVKRIIKDNIISLIHLNFCIVLHRTSVLIHVSLKFGIVLVHICF